jgi:hypothetical protein
VDCVLWAPKRKAKHWSVKCVCKNKNHWDECCVSHWFFFPSSGQILLTTRFGQNFGIVLF